MPGTLSRVGPALPMPMPSDTGIPGLTRRRVWARPEVVSHAVLILTLPRIFLAPSNLGIKPEAVRALETALDVESVLGTVGTTIDMSRIDRVQLDLPQNTIRIDYSAPTGSRMKAMIVFGSPETADTIFSKIWRRLGAEFRLQPIRNEIGPAARTPLAVMLVAAVATMLASFGLNAIADVHGGTDWVTAGWLPGWRLVSVIGGAIVAATHVWLYRRIAQPPDRLELIRT
jgi:hypothetical protein